MATGASYKLEMKVLNALVDNVPKKLDAWLEQVADNMTNDIHDELFTPHSYGRVYFYGLSLGLVEYHIASEPGFPPNPDTLALAASVHVVKNGPLDYQIEDGVLDGIFMEYGTSNIEPRPFVVPVFEDWGSGKLEQDFLDAGIFNV